MNASFQKLQQASAGFLYISESEAPFEPLTLNASADTLEEELLKLSGKPAGTVIEKTTLASFLGTTNEYQNLQEVLEQELTNVEVYKIGKRQIDVFIIGKQKEEAGYAGLRTKIVET